ncbi:hypothetical protein [Nocardia arthritidis]|uniref:Uncharacterized protein n=1 Tax=Nocardia arthritidis TaxID=228602 RepID=A0A6G9YL07_9NOCA|nr:hypothetical protein [Nocardia arthritidis]QIS13757.1 hypothetical protein F5544_29560 [Nocardia arthritidis]
MKTPRAERISSGFDRVRPPRSRPSGPLVAVAVVSFAAGIVSGGISYANRSAHREAHVAGTAAWWPHLALLVFAVVLVVVVTRRAARPAGLLLAPLGSPAAQRLRHTLAATRRHPTAALRLLVGIVPMAILVYSPWRIGEQILGGLDPNFTANAWGGPSYLGAMACHYLDAALLMAASAGLLNLLLLPAEGAKINPPR